MRLRILLMLQLFLDLVVPLLHIVVACTRFDGESTSFTVLLTVLLVVITWSLTNGTSWVLLLRHGRGESGLDWTGLGCHLLQMGPLWRFAKALSGSASSQFSNLILLHLIPVFLQDLPLSVLDVYLMLTEKKEFALLMISSSASLISAALILSSYREEVIRLTRKRKSSADDTEISHDAGPSKIVDFPALGIFTQEGDIKDKGEPSKAQVVFTVERRDIKTHDSLRLIPPSDVSNSTKVIMETDNKVGFSSASKAKLKTELEEDGTHHDGSNQNSARHWTRFIWMSSLLLSRVVSIASFTAVKPWMLPLFLPAHLLIALVGLRIQAKYAKRRSRSLACKDGLQDVATSYAYIFCFLNLKPGHALVMSSFYHTVILTESVGLVAVFLWNFEGERIYMVVVTAVAFSSFFVAMFLVVVFYCIFSEWAYLLIVEKCACCIWWNSERKQRAEKKVARKAAKLEAKKVMTQTGTQINAMATHIITTLSLLPNSPSNQPVEKLSYEDENLQDAKSQRETNDSNSRNIDSVIGSALVAVTPDETQKNCVTFEVDAFSEKQTPTSTVGDDTTSSNDDTTRLAPSEEQHAVLRKEKEPQINGIEKGKGTEEELQMKSNAPVGKKQNTSEQNLSHISAEVHSEQRPLVNRAPSKGTLKPTLNGCSMSDNNVHFLTDHVYQNGVMTDDSSVILDSEKFDEILLDENLDICTSWQKC